MSPPASRLTLVLRDAGYEIGELAGSGGTGSVYRAKNTSDQRTVAIKVLSPGIDEGRLQREADVLAHVAHQGVANVLEVGRSGEVSFLVSDWVDGRTLAEILRTDAPLAPARAMPILTQVANALDHIHTAEVLHRDVSPDNVLVDADGRATLIDFGVGRSTQSSAVTTDGLSAGTPRYLAPEAIEGHAVAASDRYGLAMIAYEMLVGTWPFPEGVDSITAAIHHHLHSTPTPPSERNSFLSSHVDEVFDTGLQKNAEDRHETARDFVDALAAALSAQSSRSGRSTLLLVIPLLVVAVATVGLLMLRGDGDAPRTAPALHLVDAWASPQSNSMPCNLLVDSDFASGLLPESWFIGDADRNAVVAFGGVADSAALAIGVTAEYGLYGQTVAISPETAYVFSADMAPAPTVSTMSIRVSWLDENFEPISDGADFEIDPATSGRYSAETTPAPANATMAVIVLGKGASIGPLVADELVFAPLDDQCSERLISS